MSWNGNSYITSPNWAGFSANKKFKNITVDNINVSSIHGYAADFNLVDASVVRTDFMFLNDTIMTTFNNILYVNNEAVFVPSSFSTISDWAYFPAKSNVTMNLNDITGAKDIYSKTLTASNSITTSNLTATNTISNTTLNNVNINTTFINGRNLNVSTISIRNISSTQISTNALYAQYAFIPFIQTSTLEFETALGRDVAISSMVANRSLYIPDEFDNDGAIFFANKELDGFYGTITTTDNRSTFVMAGGNNVGLLSLSTIQLLGSRGIDIKTVRSDLDPTTIVIDTDALGITAKAIVAIVPDVTLITSNIIFNANIVDISANQLNTNAFISTNAVFGELIEFTIGNFSTINTDELNVGILTTNNINNSSNINTATLDVSGNATINNLTANTLIANGLTVNDSADYNTFISFGTSNSGFYGAQYLYDINSLRNLQVEKITVLGGWTGDDVIPPYYNDSIVEIGEDEIRPGQVTINGFNADPLDTGTALTVRGDTQITQNLNVLGLTTLEGIVEALGDLNVDGAFTAQGTVDITGITTATGIVNCLGGLGVEGEANFLGAVTAEAGIGVIGAMGVTAGDITFGSEVDTAETFTVHYTTNFSNAVNFGNVVNFSDDVYVSTINGNQIVLKTTAISPASELLYNIDNVLTGAVSLSDSNTFALTGFNKTKITSVSNTLIQSYSNIDISANNTIFTGVVTMNNTLNMNGYDIVNVNAIYYNFLITNSVFTSNVYLSNTLTFRSPTEDTASFRFSSFMYSNGVSSELIYFRKSPFLQNDGYDFYVDKNNFLNVQSTQYVDNSNFYCYLQFSNNEANVTINNSLNNYVTSYNIASRWSKYKAAQNVDISSNNILNVNNLGLVSPYGFNLSQSNQIQHWNPGSAVYDYYIAQLSYTDLSNNITDAVASDWSYYPCKNLVLDMASNYIINCGGLTLQSLTVGQATGGYINAGIIFNQVEGDEVFYQLSKPYVADPVLDPVGSEGIYIVERSTADGSAIQYGRLYDDTIYSPTIGTGATNSIEVAGTLDMSFNVISNVSQMYYDATRQPFIQYGDVSFAGGGTQTVSLPVSYVNSNYKVQATYSTDPGSSAKPIHIDSRTTSNFTISAQSGHDAYWTTFGDNN